MLISTATLLIAATPALALNEFAASQTRAGSPVFDWLKGNMNIRTDPATVNGVAYVHITQADIGPTGGDFVAIGTVNGMGTSGGSHNCASDYDPAWNGYYDGRLGGVYFCWNFGFDAWNAGDNPSFRIEYANCEPQGYSAWVLTFAGTQRACLTSGSTSAQRLIVGLETVSNPDNSTDRNIDVKYSALYRNQTNGSAWQMLGHPPASDFIVHPNYSYTWVSDTAQNFFLAPLD